MPRQGVLPGARVLSSPAVRDGSIYKFWVYVLSSNSGTLYIGDGYLARRVHQHKIDSIEGFTEKYQIHRLVYYEAFDHIVKAISREKQTERLATAKENGFGRNYGTLVGGICRAGRTRLSDWETTP